MPDTVVVREQEVNVVVVAPPATAVTVASTAATVQVAAEGVQGPPGAPGPAGPTGATGPQGPPGPASAGAFYVHQQAVAAATWDIAHYLGFNPAVQVADSSGRLVEGDVVYVDINHLTVTFSAPFAGTATMS